MFHLIFYRKLLQIPSQSTECQDSDSKPLKLEESKWKTHGAEQENK